MLKTYSHCFTETEASAMFLPGCGMMVCRVDRHLKNVHKLSKGDPEYHRCVRLIVFLTILHNLYNIFFLNRYNTASRQKRVADKQKGAEKQTVKKDSHVKSKRKESKKEQIPEADEEEEE